MDPRESPHYSGYELVGLSPDDRFGLAKQLRIAARNRRIGRSMIRHAELRHRNFIAVTAVGLTIVLSLFIALAAFAVTR
jgi:hypothetical protein